MCAVVEHVSHRLDKSPRGVSELCEDLHYDKDALKCQCTFTRVSNVCVLGHDLVVLVSLWELWVQSLEL